MVSVRCGVFVFVIIFMSLHVVAYSLQGNEKMGLVAGDRFEEERMAFLSQQEKDALKAVPMRVDVMMNGKITRGRKTMNSKIGNEQHINGEEMPSKKASSSSANPINGNDKVTKASSSSANPRNGGHKVPKASSSSANPINGDDKRPKASSSSANPKNVDQKVPKRRNKIYHHDHDHHVEVKMRSTFMALNADYHVPRSHPPRNN